MPKVFFLTPSILPLSFLFDFGRSLGYLFFAFVVNFEKKQQHKIIV